MAAGVVPLDGLRHSPPGCSDGPTATDEDRLWLDATERTIGETGEWTNKVELADVDGDGRVLANGEAYDSPGAGRLRADRSDVGLRPPSSTTCPT